MLSKLYKKLVVVLFTSLAVSGYSNISANDTEEIAQIKQQDFYKQGESIEEDHMLSCYNTPARIDVEGTWDFFIIGSFIYWQPREAALELGYYRYTTAPVQKGKGLNSDFDYKSGLKVSLGWNTNYDNWALYADYIWISGNTSTHHHIPSTAQATRNIWYSRDESLDFNEIKSSWDITTHVLDGNIGRACYVGKNLIFNPFGGIRAYWIYQKFSPKYLVGTLPYSVFCYSDTWNLGLRAGTDIDWLLGENFSIIGKVAASLAIQHCKTSKKCWDYSDVVTFNMYHKYYALVPNVDGSIGLGWGKYFSLNQSEVHVDFNALYEFLFFVDQNAMIYMNNLDNEFAGLALHGLTVTLKVDF